MDLPVMVPLATAVGTDPIITVTIFLFFLLILLLYLYLYLYQDDMSPLQIHECVVPSILAGGYYCSTPLSGCLDSMPACASQRTVTVCR